MVCYRKARRKINDREVRSVQDVLNEGYRNDDLDFPSGKEAMVRNEYRYTK